MALNKNKKDRSETEAPDQQSVIEANTKAFWESQRPSYESWAAEAGESPAEYDDMINGHVEFARSTYQHQRARVELKQYEVKWDSITKKNISELNKLLSQNPDEAAMQRFLEDNPNFLIQVLGGGHGRYQIPKQRLGTEFITDFLVSEMSSIGVEWYLVEIESPRDVCYRQDGLASEPLNIAIGQIRDWREWLRQNISYARKPKVEHGLGLIGIDDRAAGLIIIGRREKYPERFNEFRRQMIHSERIIIHSYDWLLDAARTNRSGILCSELEERS